jgi:hypothetical protein
MIIFGIACDHADQQKSQWGDSQDEGMLRTHLSVASLNMFESKLLFFFFLIPVMKLMPKGSRTVSGAGVYFGSGKNIQSRLPFGADEKHIRLR